jgi:hypothetical protein
MFTSFARVGDSAGIAIIRPNCNRAGRLAIMFRWQAFFRNQAINLIVVRNNWSSLSPAGYRALVIYEALQCIANRF